MTSEFKNVSIIIPALDETYLLSQTVDIIAVCWRSSTRRNKSR